MAIEDSYLLGKALENNYRYTSYDSFTITSFAEKKEKEKVLNTEIDILFMRDNHTINMKKVFADFEESRYVLFTSYFFKCAILFFSLFIFFIIIVNDKKIVFESKVNKKFKSTKIHLINSYFNFNFVFFRSDLREFVNWKYFQKFLNFLVTLKIPFYAIFVIFQFIISRKLLKGKFLILRFE